KCTVKPGGTTACSYLSATLQVGYGLEFASATLDFMGGTYKTKRPDGPGSMLAMSRGDCPIIAVQGARGTTILNASLQGPMQAHIQGNKLGLIGVNPAIDDTQ